LILSQDQTLMFNPFRSILFSGQASNLKKMTGSSYTSFVKDPSITTF